MKTFHTFPLIIALGVAFFSHTSIAFSPLPTASTTRTALPWTHSKPIIPANTSPFDYKQSELSVSFGENSSEENASRKNDNMASSPSPQAKLASSLGALAVLAFVVLFHESGHYLAAKSYGVPIDEFSVGIGPKLLGIEAFNGDQFNLRALPIGGYVSLNTASLAALPVLPRIEILSAGVLFNLLLSTLIYAGQILTGDGLPVSVFDKGAVVGGMDDGAAAKSTLQPGNVIQTVNGKKVLASSTSSEMEVQRAISKVIDEVQNTPDGEFVEFTVLKNPKASTTTNVKVKPTKKEGGRASLGVYLVPNFVGKDVRKTDNPLEAATFGASQVYGLTKETAIGLITFAGDFFSGKSDSSEYSVSGPVGVVKRASEVVKTQERDIVLKYMAAVSINLGVLNCFPIPPSDGFQILWTAGQALWQKL